MNDKTIKQKLKEQKKETELLLQTHKHLNFLFNQKQIIRLN